MERFRERPGLGIEEFCHTIDVRWKFDSFFLIEPHCPAGPGIKTRLPLLEWVGVYVCVYGCLNVLVADDVMVVILRRESSIHARTLLNLERLSTILCHTAFALLRIGSFFFFTTIFAFRHAPLNSLSASKCLLSEKKHRVHSFATMSRPGVLYSLNFSHVSFMFFFVFFFFLTRCLVRFFFGYSICSSSSSR